MAMGRYLLIGFVGVRQCFATLETRLKLVSRLGSAETYRYVSRQVITVTRSRAFGDLPASALPMALWLLVTGDFLRPDASGLGRVVPESAHDLGWRHA